MQTTESSSTMYLDSADSADSADPGAFEGQTRIVGRHVHRHLAVLVAISAIGDASTRELQRIVGRSRRAIQDIIRDLRACNVVIQSHQTVRKHRYRLINKGPYSLKRAKRLIQSKHPDIMNRILLIKAEHDREDESCQVIKRNM